MSKISAYRPGQFCWIDLLTPSAEPAKRFYGEVFGWKTLDNPTDQGGFYTMFRQGDLDVAGMGEMGDELKQTGMPAVWNSYVSVDDAETFAAKAEELGATIEMPVMQVMTAGRMAILVDPVGARVSIWEPGEHIGASLVNEPVSLAWNDLGTREPERAMDFYGALFGWKFKEAGEGYFEIQLGERSNGGIRRMGPDERDMPPFWMPYISVADCDESVAQITARGGTAVMDPVDIDPGRFCVVSDPQGAFFTVMKVNEPE